MLIHDNCSLAPPGRAKTRVRTARALPAQDTHNKHGELVVAIAGAPVCDERQWDARGAKHSAKHSAPHDKVELVEAGCFLKFPGAPLPPSPIQSPTTRS